MSVATVQLFYALLAIVAMGFIGMVVLVRAAAAVSDGARDAYDSIADAIAPHALSAAWFVAFLATAGSLYFSEVAGFEPCRLCWYQRIAMYPLVVLLAVAAARRERVGVVYAAPVAAIGAAISAYHVALEWVPALDTGACSATVPCTLVWFRELGFISLPVLALTAFALILTLLTFRWTASPEPGGTDDPSGSTITP